MGVSADTRVGIVVVKRAIWFNVTYKVSWCWFKLLESNNGQFILDIFQYCTPLEEKFPGDNYPNKL